MANDFPRSLQIRFEKSIVKKEYLDHQSLTCGELAERYSVSPEDMETVLSAEYRKGLVDRCGPGFQILGVAAPSFDSLFQHTTKTGMKPTSNVRAVLIEPAQQEVADKLELCVGAAVYRMERTRNINNEVIANQTNYIPLEVCPGLEDDDVSHYSFQRLLEEKYYTVVAELREEIALMPATEKDSEILGLASAATVLVVQRLSFSVTHRPLVWADIHIRPDRYQFVASLWPAAAKILETST